MYFGGCKIEIRGLLFAGVGAAAKAGLTFMVGGEKESFERAKPVLECMGKNSFYCGSHGTGQVSADISTPCLCL